MKAIVLMGGLLILAGARSEAKEIALTFDDAPVEDSRHYSSVQRTEELIRKLKALNVPSVMIFANACKGQEAAVVAQLRKYTDAGHLIANHTCGHPRLDDVGFASYAADAAKGDKILAPLFSGQKYFRFPFLNESNEEKLRDQMREWLAQNGYRNGMVSVDNDDYIVSFKINQAKNQGKKINYKRVEKAFLEHLLGAADFYDDLAVKTLGRSPKHVMLLHEVDATVMFVDSLVKELRKRGWTIIGADEAFRDPLYLEQPKNTYSGNGIVAQVAFEKTGQRIGYYKFDELKAKLNKILGLN